MQAAKHFVFLEIIAASKTLLLNSRDLWACGLTPSARVPPPPILVSKFPNTPSDNKQIRSNYMMAALAKSAHVPLFAMMWLEAQRCNPLRNTAILSNTMQTTESGKSKLQFPRTEIQPRMPTRLVIQRKRRFCWAPRLH